MARRVAPRFCPRTRSTRTGLVPLRFPLRRTLVRLRRCPGLINAAPGFETCALLPWLVMTQCLAFFDIILIAARLRPPTPSITAGVVTSRLNGRFQGDLRTSEAPIRGDEDGGLDIRPAPRWHDGRAGTSLSRSSRDRARDWREFYLDHRRQAGAGAAGIFKLPFGSTRTPRDEPRIHLRSRIR